MIIIGTAILSQLDVVTLKHEAEVWLSADT